MTITLNGTNGITTPEVVLDNTAADGGQVVLKSSGYNNWNLDNYSGRLRGYYGSTEYFTVNSSGNVGIGTSSPSGKLHVVNGSTVEARFSSPSNVYADLYLNTWALDRARIRAEAANPGAGSGTGSGALSFWVAQNPTMTEAMRIDSSGNLLVGTTSTGVASGGFSFQPGYNGTGKSAAFFGHVAGTGSGNQYCVFVYDGTFIGSITQNGTTAVAYNTSSDYRLKENIQPMQNALGVVAQLNPVTYTWKADGSDGQGFIAHELQAVVPDCVTGEKDAVDAEGKPVYQGIDTSFLVATLTKAIQEQQEQIEQMKQEIAALKGAA